MKNEIAPLFLNLHLYLPGYPHPLSKNFGALFDYSPIVETLYLTKEYPTVCMLICSVPSGGQLLQCKYTDLLCLRFNLLSLLKNKPSGNC